MARLREARRLGACEQGPRSGHERAAACEKLLREQRPTGGAADRQFGTSGAGACCEKATREKVPRSKVAQHVLDKRAVASTHVREGGATTKSARS